MRLELRDYQIDALARIDAADRAGSRRLLGVAATGLGKTVIFMALAARRQGRALILAHRDELVAQAAGKAVELWPELGVTPHTYGVLCAMDHPAAADGLRINPNGIGIVKAGADDVRAHVVVASVQTLSRPTRMARLLAATESEFALMGDCDPFGLVVVDEAHHAAAVTYRAVLEQLHAGEVGGPLLLGVTATPDRGDGVGLDDLFQQVVFHYDILWGIGQGYLSDIRGKAVKVQGLDVDAIKTVGGKSGDYQAGDAGRAMEDAGAPGVIARAIKRHAKGRRTLVFTPTVSMATEVAAECVGVGLTAGWISGETPMDDRTGPDGTPVLGRRSILREYRAGEIQVLANCAVLTEGFDDPATSCVVVARPTKSRALYTQMVGRGTRRHPEKDHLLVLDVVGASAEHSLITIPSLFGLGGKLRTKARNGTADITELVEERQRIEVAEGRVRVEDVELFHTVRAAGIAWIPTHSKSAPRKRFVRPMPQYTGHPEVPTVVLGQVEAGADLWMAGLQLKSGAQRRLIDRVSLDQATGVAEDAVRKLTSSSRVMADAAWRSEPPDRRLVAVAGKWRVKVDPAWDAGRLQDEIDKRAARAAQWKQRKAWQERQGART